MRFMGFSVENYKSIRSQVTVKPLRIANCLIGPNNEGESSVLEVLLLLRHLTHAYVANDSDAQSFFGERLFKKSRENLFKIILEFAYFGKDVNSDPDHSNADLGDIACTLSWGGQVPDADPRYINITGAEVNPKGDVPPIWAVTGIKMDGVITQGDSAFKPL